MDLSLVHQNIILVEILEVQLDYMEDLLNEIKRK